MKTVAMTKYGINGRINYLTVDKLLSTNNGIFLMVKQAVFLTVGLFFLIVSAYTQSTELSLYTEHRPPFQFNQNNQVTGFSTEIVQAMLAQTSFKATIAMSPWTRAYNLAQKKPNSCIYAIARTKHRENLFRWTQPYVSTNTLFIGLKSSADINLTTIEDAKKYRIAVLRDDVTHQLLKSHGFIENKNMYIVNNPSSMLKLLIQRNMIDLILTDQITLQYRAKYLDIDPELFSSFLTLNQEPLSFYLACSLSTAPSVVETLSAGFEKIKHNGDYKRIMQKWLGDESTLVH